MSKAEATVRAIVMMYKVVTQLVLLYGSEIWVVMGDMLRVIEGFHYQVYIRITGMKVWRTMSREWDHPLVAEVLDTDGLWPIKEYIQQSKDNIENKVA